MTLFDPIHKIKSRPFFDLLFAGLPHDAHNTPPGNYLLTSAIIHLSTTCLKCIPVLIDPESINTPNAKPASPSMSARAFLNPLLLAPTDSDSENSVSLERMVNSSVFEEISIPTHGWVGFTLQKGYLLEHQPVWQFFNFVYIVNPGSDTYPTPINKTVP